MQSLATQGSSFPLEKKYICCSEQLWGGGVQGSNKAAEGGGKLWEQNLWHRSPKRLPEVAEGQEKLSAQFHDTIIQGKLQPRVQLCGLQQLHPEAFLRPSIPSLQKKQTHFGRKAGGDARQ